MHLIGYTLVEDEKLVQSNFLTEKFSGFAKQDECADSVVVSV